MDKFFNQNQNELNENDDELCFVDSLKQQSYDDKVNFDNDQIFINVIVLFFYYINLLINEIIYV